MDGVSVADPGTHPELVMAFELAAAGASDRDVARGPTDAGYRTTGNWDRNPFTKDTVRPMLQYHFYLGKLPDGSGGSIPSKHAPIIDAALLGASEAARFRNLRGRHNTGSPTRQPWALSGVATCDCGATMRASGRADRRRRVECSSQGQGLARNAPMFYADIGGLSSASCCPTSSSPKIGGMLWLPSGKSTVASARAPRWSAKPSG